MILSFFYLFSTNFLLSLFYINIGDAMKKKLVRSVIIPLLFAIFLGFYGAKITYDFYQIKKDVTQISHNAYAIQYGVYTNADTLNKNLSDLDDYVVSLEDGKYYVYLGFTTSHKNLNKLKNIYEDNDMEVYTKEIFIDNTEFVSNLEQFDVLIDNVSGEDDILSINEAVLSSYEEIILGN